jgi:hypothetical protein
MNQLPLFSKEIGDIYFVANTPTSFYRMMRQNYFIQKQLSVLPAEVLISEFYRRAKEPVNNHDEIAEIYAIFIALTFKEPEEVSQFFQDALNMKFEWFADIARYYLDNPTPIVSYQTIEVKMPKYNTSNHISYPLEYSK